MQRKTEEKIRQRELEELNNKIQREQLSQLEQQNKQLEVQNEQLEVQNKKINNSIKKLLELNVSIEDISKTLDISISEIKNIAKNI